MIDRVELLKDLQRQVKTLEADLRQQVTAVEETHTRLRAEYDKAFKLKRTAATWGAWRDERVTQAAAAWALGTVFVRFCEDNRLLGSRRFLAGPSDEDMTLAEEAQAQFYRDHQGNQTDRGWLLAAFAEMSKAQAGALLFDQRHNALYQIPLSHDAAKGLIAFWRHRNEQGILVHNFTDDNWDTRFLGDLYQDLSEAARKTYALLQTPEFVEEFILDRTLSPAINEFGHDAIKMIDPTCGSGHFLLGAFRRLLEEWERNAPGRELRERVKLALDAVHGVDVNPFAVAIARFRLVIAALRAAGFRTLNEAASHHFPLNIAIGDALIKARKLTLPGFEDLGGESDELAEFQYTTEDLHEHPQILKEGRYHVVVGNPPYIQVKDRNLNQLYREIYRDVCSGQYALSVPFAQRFFQLAKEADKSGEKSGYVGQITSNSFMKREFGRKLIREYFPQKVELTQIIDTSGAYIPGHGTPTVILVGRRRSHFHHTSTIRAILGIKGEPGVPERADKGRVWMAICSQIDAPGTESEWVSSINASRASFSEFPWSLTGGGAAQVMDAINSGSAATVRNKVDSVGFCAVTREDDAYAMPHDSLARHGVPREVIVDLIDGSAVRDWGINSDTAALLPYDPSSLKPTIDTESLRLLWPARTHLRMRRALSGTQEEQGLTWFEYSSFTRKRFASPYLISFPFVATHSSFALSRDRQLFIRTAPVITLPLEAKEEEYLHLLGVLNSSTASFWLKQVSHDKGSQGVNEGFKSQPWERFYEFTGTKLQELPLPAQYPTALAREIDELSQQLAATTPAAITASDVPSKDQLESARASYRAIRGRMIGLQEELDWKVYSHYGLLEDLTVPASMVPEIQFGERAFEISLARKMNCGEEETQWFARHDAEPITDLPDHWSPTYTEIVRKRINIIENNRSIELIERPENKRRWASESWEEMQEKALRRWLLRRAESREIWFHEVDGMEQPKLQTTAELADTLALDPDFVAVAELYAPGKDLTKLLTALTAEEHVPFLAALRYKEAALRKRADWDEAWDCQRFEDAAETEEEREAIRDSQPVPSKYASGDFLKPSYWRNRGKLDVPKERFISYPHASRKGDLSLLLGWGGWNYREQAQALATLIVERESNDGWEAEQLTPLLAGLREIMPWVRQWHGDFDISYGDSPASVYAGFLIETTNRLHLTDDAMASWRPPRKGAVGAIQARES